MQGSILNLAPGEGLAVQLWGSRLAGVLNHHHSVEADAVTLSWLFAHMLQPKQTQNTGCPVERSQAFLEQLMDIREEAVAGLRGSHTACSQGQVQRPCCA